MAGRLGVSATNWNERKTASRKLNRVPRANSDYFNVWGPNVAWLCGYVWADGCVQVQPEKYAKALILGCITEDEELIRHVLRELSCGVNISRYPAKVSKEGIRAKAYSRATVYEPAVVDSLVSLGIVPRKSFLDPPYPLVPDEYFWHFARGVFDGDGSVSSKKSSNWSADFCGTFSFIDTLEEKLRSRLEVPPITVRRRPNTKLALFSLTKYETLAKFYTELYKEPCQLFLSRKRIKLRDYLRERLSRPRSRNLPLATYHPDLLPA